MTSLFSNAVSKTQKSVLIFSLKYIVIFSFDNIMIHIYRSRRTCRKSWLACMNTGPRNTGTLLRTTSIQRNIPIDAWSNEQLWNIKRRVKPLNASFRTVEAEGFQLVELPISECSITDGTRSFLMKIHRMKLSVWLIENTDCTSSAKLWQ
jgi:hypothetical protein